MYVCVYHAYVRIYVYTTYECVMFMCMTRRCPVSVTKVRRYIDICIIFLCLYMYIQRMCAYVVYTYIICVSYVRIRSIYIYNMCAHDTRAPVVSDHQSSPPYVYNVYVSTDQRSLTVINKLLSYSCATVT